MNDFYRLMIDAEYALVECLREEEEGEDNFVVRQSVSVDDILKVTDNKCSTWWRVEISGGDDRRLEKAMRNKLKAKWGLVDVQVAW